MRRLLLLLITCVLLFSNNHTHAKPALDESTLKAVFTYKFAKFTQWPSTPESSFKLCILGKDSLSSSALAAIKNKSVANNPIQIERFQSGLLPEEALRSCFILFISQSERKRIIGILAELNQYPILTISDIEGFSQHTGMITLQMVDQQLRFQINASSLHKAGLSISSKIMELGTVIDPLSPPEKRK